MNFEQPKDEEGRNNENNNKIEKNKEESIWSLKERIVEREGKIEFDNEIDKIKEDLESRLSQIESESDRFRAKDGAQKKIELITFLKELNNDFLKKQIEAGLSEQEIKEKLEKESSLVKLGIEKTKELKRLQEELYNISNELEEIRPDGVYECKFSSIYGPYYMMSKGFFHADNIFYSDVAAPREYEEKRK